MDKIPELEEFDLDYAVGMVGGEDALLNILKNYYYYLGKTSDNLNKYISEIDNSKGLDLYRNEVHSLKSSSKSVGALLVSQIARLLELASKAGDLERIRMVNPILLEQIERHKKILSVLVYEDKEKVDRSVILPLLEMLDNSLGSDNYKVSDFIVEKIKKYSVDEETDKILEEIVCAVVNFDSQMATALIREICE